MPQILHINFYAKNVDLDEISKFLKRHKPPKLIQDKIDILNNPISIKEIKFIVNNLLPPHKINRARWTQR